MINDRPSLEVGEARPVPLFLQSVQRNCPYTALRRGFFFSSPAPGTNSQKKETTVPGLLGK